LIYHYAASLHHGLELMAYHCVLVPVLRDVEHGLKQEPHNDLVLVQVRHSDDDLVLVPELNNNVVLVLEHNNDKQELPHVLDTDLNLLPH
jgi:hypothetical protein